jgi:hypothetical protein
MDGVRCMATTKINAARKIALEVNYCDPEDLEV